MPPCYRGKRQLLKTKKKYQEEQKIETYTTFILKQVQKCTKMPEGENKYDSHLITSKRFSLVQR